MDKKKIGKAKGRVVTKSEAKKGAAAMSQAMTSRARPKTHSQMKVK